MPTCIRCKKEVGLLSGSLGFNKNTNRCSNCEKEVASGLNGFRQAFLKYCADGLLSNEEIAGLKNGVAQLNLDWSEALQFVRGDAMYFLERTLAFIAADGIINDEEDANFKELYMLLALPYEMGRPLVDRFQYMKEISAIRLGKLPSVNPTVQLESDETCHLEVDARYHQVGTSKVTQVIGRLVATNKKLYFLSSSNPTTIIWKNVLRVERESQGVYVELSTKKGNGLYQVADAVLVQAVLLTLTRIAKRQLLAPQDDSEVSRHIPQDVKTAVWQRDQGKCTQCGSTSYLEFDHIIPFSKGGASTITNVQLLCRRCNLAKADRI
ncbi:MAG: hypothetical protein BroJett018_37330 [Chloroflexota bacterium]|nr:HNH endonuclease [Chloroflexota bacterium]NOG64220.1 HNH endonuclease [Chloroflexota bacterium]GIK65939.1 MAG: hypothetical protein BroJett018_37330 [Chloroflexota bacterium]